MQGQGGGRRERLARAARIPHHHPRAGVRHGQRRRGGDRLSRTHGPRDVVLGEEPRVREEEGRFRQRRIPLRAASRRRTRGEGDALADRETTRPRGWRWTLRRKPEVRPAPGRTRERRVRTRQRADSALPRARVLAVGRHEHAELPARHLQRHRRHYARAGVYASGAAHRSAIPGLHQRKWSVAWRDQAAGRRADLDLRTRHAHGREGLRASVRRMEPDQGVLHAREERTLRMGRCKRELHDRQDRLDAFAGASQGPAHTRWHGVSAP